MSYDRVIRAARSIPWAIEESHFEAVLAFLELKAAGGFVDTDTSAAFRTEGAAAKARANSMRSQSGGAVSVIPLLGVISQRSNLMSSMSGPGGTSIDRFTSDFRQAVNDAGVKAIVIPVCSPGGTVSGVSELSGEIRAARSKKPITAVASSQIASAAYWAVAGATEIVASPSSTLGSIGVFCSHTCEAVALDKAGLKVTIIKAGRFKAEQDSSIPLSDEAEAAMQSLVDDYYSSFVQDVAKGRNVSTKAVVESFGQGRMVTATRAVQLKMADRIGTYDDVMAKYGINTMGNSDSRVIASGAQAFLPQEEFDAMAELRQFRTAQEKRRQAMQSRREEALARTQGSFGSARDRGHGGGF